MITRSFYLFDERFQIFIFSASQISSSRKSGCAIDIIRSARSQVEAPFKLTIPFSVTKYWMLQRVSVTTEPSFKVGRILLC